MLKKKFIFILASVVSLTMKLVHLVLAIDTNEVATAECVKFSAKLAVAINAKQASLVITKKR